jgi:hypothetical protein
MVWQDDALDCDDLALVERVAQQIVEQRGADAVTYLAEQADISEDRGDVLSVRAWLDIAGCAKDLSWPRGEPGAHTTAGAGRGAILRRRRA